MKFQEIIFIFSVFWFPVGIFAFVGWKFMNRTEAQHRVDHKLVNHEIRIDELERINEGELLK